MKTPWHTAWQGSDVVVFRDDTEVDRFSAEQVQRVIFVHRGSGETPGDLSFAVVELPDGGAVLACGLSYHLQGTSTRLIELQPCECPEPPLPPADRIHADSFELCP